MENEDLVNLPNWLTLRFRIEDGDWFNLDDVDDRARFRQELDLKAGVSRRRVPLSRRRRAHDVVGRAPLGRRRPSPTWRRCQVELTAEDWSGTVESRSPRSTATCINAGVERYRELDSRHLGARWRPASSTTRRHSCRSCDHPVAPRDRAGGAHPGVPPRRTARPRRASWCATSDGLIGQACACACSRGAGDRREDGGALHLARRGHLRGGAGCTQRRSPKSAASSRVQRRHSLAWEHLWRRCDIGWTSTTTRSTTATHARVAPAHLPPAADRLAEHHRIWTSGVPARGWHGEAYRGHIFWDELFIFPFLNLRMPEITRALLTLPLPAPATRRARGAGGRLPRGDVPLAERQQRPRGEPGAAPQPAVGALGARQHPPAAPRQRGHRLQRLAVLPGHRRHGVPARSTAPRCSSRSPASGPASTTYNEERDRYEIRGVMGPDEYHDAYPGAEQAGPGQQRLHQRDGRLGAAQGPGGAAIVLPELRVRELRDMLELDRRRGRALARTSAARCACCFHDDGIISQFEGYEELEEFDWEAYRRAYGDIQRLDRILEAEGDTPNRYKAIQAGRRADAVLPVLRRGAAAASSSGWATPSSARRSSRTTSTTTSSAPRTARRSAGWCTPGCRPAATARQSWELFMEALRQ